MIQPQCYGRAIDGGGLLSFSRTLTIKAGGWVTLSASFDSQTTAVGIGGTVAGRNRLPIRMPAWLRRSYPRGSLLNWLFHIGHRRTFAGSLQLWIKTPPVQPPDQFILAIGRDARRLVNALRAGGQCGKKKHRDENHTGDHEILYHGRTAAGSAEPHGCEPVGWLPLLEITQRRGSG